MNKLSKKFITGIVIILAVSSFCSVSFNTRFIERFYLYQKKADVTKIRSEFINLLQQGNSPRDAMERIETSHKAIIAQINNEPASNYDKINAKIQTAFQEKGIGFQKYWFWEEDYKRVFAGENRIRLYHQEKLNYSLLVNYIQKGSSLYAITIIVPNVSDAFQIANHFLIAVTVSTIIIAIIFIALLIKKITKPLSLFVDFADHMKNNDFTPIKVHTKDELESAADSLNSMGNQVIQFQRSLQEKNLQMEQLLDNVAHDLKTPVSLIQLYAHGIKDGIDDGTFLDTILEENKQISNMADRLLYLSRIEKKQHHRSQINVSDMIQQLVNKYSILAKENQTEIHAALERGLFLYGSEELLQSVFLNLITNAVKYSSGAEVIINLYGQKNEIVFTIINETENDRLDIEKIWRPYYVGEQSRNKKLSGTGLGLSIVRKVCENEHYSIQCSLHDKKILFTVSMPVSQEENAHKDS